MAPTAPERGRRILAIIPWVSAQGGATIGDICDRFDVSARELVRDLETFGMTGVYPYSPDVMNEIMIEGDWVSINVAPHFRRPIRLTVDQVVGVLGSLAAVAGQPGVEVDGPQARALQKVRAALASPGAVKFDVDLGDADADILEMLRRAVPERRRIQIDYYGAGRDQSSTRLVDPLVVSTRDGFWYLAAWCHTAQDDRLFRVDRISAARPTSQTFELGEFADARSGPSVDPTAPLVTMSVRPAGRVLLERVPVEGLVEHADGSVEVTLRVGSVGWFVTLLLRLGSDAEVIRVESEESDGELAAQLAPASLVEAVRTLAERTRARYG